jgi:predicted helicase
MNYEEVPPYEGVQVSGDNPLPGEDLYRFYRVKKMKFAKKTAEIDGKKKKIDDKSTIVYNSRITISNIPEKAYEYVVNGKSAIEWIMERYQVKTDKKSGITNDPNDWSLEHEKPRYILDLLLSIINVSVQTVDIVNSLPKLEFETN